MPHFLVRSLPAVAAFLVSLGATVATVRHFVVTPHEYFCRSKLEFFEANKDDYTAVFFGSSLIFRSFIPGVIDAELQKAGIDWRSFNLGVPDMHGLEADYYLRQVLRLKPARLKWVVLEFDTFRADIGENLQTYRSIFWHDVLHTLRAWRVVEVEGHSSDEAWELRAGHSSVGAKRLLNLGLGPRMLEDHREGIPDGSLLGEEQLRAGQGFVAMDEGMPPDRISPRIARNLQEFRRLVGLLGRRNARAADFSSFPVEVLREQVRLVEDAGIEVLYLVGPGIRAADAQLRLAEAGEVPVLFAYNDPEKYPQLYAVECRFDPMHPNRRGAILTSRLFAADLQEHLRQEGESR